MRTVGGCLGALLLLVTCASCDSQSASPSEENRPADVDPQQAHDGQDVAAFLGTTPLVTHDELLAALEAMPPSIRRQFATAAGRRELLEAEVDKRLLVLEARRRGLAEQEDIRAEVRALEERLIVKALLEEEERALLPVSDDDLRQHYEAVRHRLSRSNDGLEPSFEEAREEVRARLDARRRRKVFDSLVEKLRASADVTVNEQVLH